MANIVFKDRVKENCTFNGIGAVQLNGPIEGFTVFDDAATDYIIRNYSSSVWEIGEGIVSAGTLNRVTIYSNSLGTTDKIDFGTDVGIAFQDIVAFRLNGLSESIVDNLTDLDDTPADYITAALNILRVNGLESATEFVPLTADIVLFDTTVTGDPSILNVQEIIDFQDDQIGLRETASTGVTSGGSVSQDTGSTVNISAGTGEIVDGYSDRINPVKINVSWSDTLAYPIIMGTSIGSQYIFVDIAGVISQQGTPLSETQKRTSIELAIVYYKDTSIDTVVNSGILSNEVGNTLYDFLGFIGSRGRIQGMGLKTVDAQLEIWAEEGKLFSPGANAVNSITNPNILVFPQIGNSTTAAVFDVVFSDGSLYLAAQTTIPTVIELTPGATSNLGNKIATIHYFYRTHGNGLILQLGQIKYSDGNVARDSLTVDATNYNFFTNNEVTILSSQVYLQGNSSDFSDSSIAGLVNIIGSSSGGAGSSAISEFINLLDVDETTFIASQYQVPTVNALETALVFEHRINWKGLWTSQTYYPHEMSRDGDWTGIANTTTSERLAPQDVGNVLSSIDQTLTPTNESNVSIVTVVHKYTLAKNGYVKGLQVRAPAWTLDAVTKVTITNEATGESNVINDPILSVDDEWVTLNVSNSFVTVGQIFSVTFEYYTSTPGSNVSGGWTSLLSAGAPANNQIAIDNLITPTVISFSHLDLDNGSRGTELDGVVIGSIIHLTETADTTRNLRCEVTSVNTAPSGYTTYTVNQVTNGPKELRTAVTLTCDIDIPISTASEYTTFPNLWATNSPFATVTSELYYDGIEQTNTNDAYGINVLLQEAYISPDWDIISFSGGGTNTGGGGGEGAEFFTELLDTPATFLGSEDFVLQVKSDGTGVTFVAETAGLILHIANTTDPHTASSIINVPAGLMLDTDVQAAINTLDGRTSGNSTNLSDHLMDLVDAHVAESISNVPSGANITSTNIQGAVDELNTAITLNTNSINSHEISITAHAAVDITYDNATSGLTATDVKNALDELSTVEAGLPPWRLVTGSETLTSGDRVVASSLGGTFILVLPLAPTFGQEVEIKDADDNFANINISLGRNSELIAGVAEDMILDLSNAYVRLVFRGSSTGWLILSRYN